MKVAVAVALVAACLATSYAAPVTHAPDWQAVEIKVGEIESIVRSAVQQVKSIANNDNVQVGADIERKLDAAAAQATEVLEEVGQEIRDRTLTEASAKQFFDRLKLILGGVQIELRDDLAKLSDTARNAITAIFSETYSTVETKAEELYALLRAFAVQAVDWEAVQAKVEDIEDDIRDAVGQIREIANNDNATVGADIGAKLDVAAQNALVILEQANQAIRNQSLTEAQAKQILQGLQADLMQLRADLQVDLDKLSTGARDNIVNIFNAAYVSVEQKAQALYALLRAFAPQAIDWQAVQAKVGEIETEIRNTVGQIREIANNDNAQVGADIGAKLDVAAQNALQILEQANQAIRDQTLTEEDAKRILQGLQADLMKLRDDLQADLARLSAGASKAITDAFNAAYVSVEQKAQALYALLRQ